MTDSIEAFAKALEQYRERTNQELVDEFLEIGRYDWYVTQSYNRLHYAELDDEQKSYIPEYWAIPVPVRLACGRTASRLAIPGIFTRMAAQRCTGCCRALGYPLGKGSPKNDPGCRAVLETAAGDGFPEVADV